MWADGRKRGPAVAEDNGSAPWICSLAWRTSPPAGTYVSSPSPGHTEEGRPSGQLGRGEPYGRAGGKGCLGRQTSRIRQGARAWGEGRREGTRGWPQFACLALGRAPRTASRTAGQGGAFLLGRGGGGVAVYSLRRSLPVEVARLASLVHRNVAAPEEVFFDGRPGGVGNGVKGGYATRPSGTVAMVAVVCIACRGTLCLRYG